MVITMRDYCWRYGMACCTQCNDMVIAPDWSKYESRHRVRHSWCCDNCGHEFETSVDLSVAPVPGLGQHRKSCPIPLVA
jgi:hypothetical protein